MKENNSKRRPSVSIIIPCYNQGHYISEALESVIRQTYQNWEAIIVNDGSTDSTSHFVREFIQKHPSLDIFLLEKENGGLARARNYGIEHARGKFILPLDSDDKIDSRMLEKCVHVLEENTSVSIVYTDQQNFGLNGNLLTTRNYNFKKLLDDNHLVYCSLYRREIWEKVNGYKPCMKWGYEDWEFWIATGEKGYYGIRIPEPLFFYRVRDSSMYSNALAHDLELHAQIVINHPNLFSANVVRLGKRLIDLPNATDEKQISSIFIFTKYLFGMSLAYNVGNISKIVHNAINYALEVIRYIVHRNKP